MGATFSLLAFLAYCARAATDAAHVTAGPYRSPLAPPLLLGVAIVLAVLRAGCLSYRSGWARVSGRASEAGMAIHALHRATCYVALFGLPILWADAGRAAVWHGEPGMGVGTAVLAANAALLTAWTLGCPSARHRAGG